MSTFEWFLLIVVVIVVPLVVAVVVTLWTLEQARARNRRNRVADGGEGAAGEPVKRLATGPADPDQNDAEPQAATPAAARDDSRA